MCYSWRELTWAMGVELVTDRRELRKTGNGKTKLNRLNSKELDNQENTKLQKTWQKRAIYYFMKNTLAHLEFKSKKIEKEAHPETLRFHVLKPMNLWHFWRQSWLTGRCTLQFYVDYTLLSLALLLIKKHFRASELIEQFSPTSCNVLLI